MNVKRWALFFLLTLCVNYVTATLFGGGGGLLSEGRKVGGLLSEGGEGGGLESEGGKVGGLESEGGGGLLSEGGKIGGLLSEGGKVGGLLSKGGGLLSEGGGLLNEGGKVGGLLSEGGGGLLSEGGGGGLLHGGSHDDGSWTSCTKTQHKFFESKISEIRKTSRFGSRLRLGARETKQFKLTEVKAGGFDDFKMGPRSWYRFENGVLLLRFSVIFGNVRTTSFFSCPKGAGGILGDFIETIQGIISGLIDIIFGGILRIFLEIRQPPLLCDVVVKVDQKDGCRLKNFRFQKPVGPLLFMGRLATHQRRLRRFHDFLRLPFYTLLGGFFHDHFHPFLHGCIRKWNGPAVHSVVSRHHTAGIERSVSGGGYSNDGSYEERSYREDTYDEESDEYESYEIDY